MDAGTIVSIVSALGIGSFIGQYFTGAQQRRTLRSQVLSDLANVESARWAGEDLPEPSFQQAIHALETSALIARLPRNVIVEYKILAHTASWMSAEAYEDDPNPFYGGGISGALADVVRASAAEVSRLVWSPWLGRLRLRTRLHALDERASAISDTGVQSTLQRARGHVGF